MSEYPSLLAPSVYRTFMSAIYQSIDNKDTNMFSSLNSFFYSRLKTSYENNDLQSFADYSNGIVYYYEYSLDKFQSSITFKDIYQVCAESSARLLKDKLTYGFMGLLGEEIEVEEKIKNNRFSEVLLNRFSELIHIAIKYRDIKHLTFIFNQLYQVSNTTNPNIYNTRAKIEYWKNKVLTSEEKVLLKNTKEQLELDSFVDDFARRIFKVTLFWSYFLSSLNVLNSEDLMNIDEIFKGYQGFIDSEFMIDLFHLRDYSLSSKYSWEHWDYTERPEGVVYTPPTANFWITRGALIYLLKTKGVIPYNITNNSPGEINALEFLLLSMGEILNSLKETGYLKWKNFFNISEKDFIQRIYDLENQVQSLKQNNISQKERQIAALSISSKIITNVKKIIADAYGHQNIVRLLFEQFRNIKFETDRNSDFLIVGERNTIWPGIKQCLIDEEQFYVPFIGFEQYGNRLATYEENLFLIEILKKDRIETTNILTEINSSIQTISNKGFSPSLIIIGYDAWHYTFSNLKSGDFELDYNNTKGFDFRNYGGDYKNIPVVKFPNEIIKNGVIVADFRASFLLEQEVDDLDNKNSVVIDLTDISESDAVKIISQNPEYWTKNLSEDEAKIKLRNSVKYDCYSVLRFTIRNSAAYSLIIKIDS